MKKGMKKEKEKKKKKKKTRGKKRKKGTKGYYTLPRRNQKLIFYMRIVKKNRNEIETQKKSDFEHPTKKNEKMKENERT